MDTMVEEMCEQYKVKVPGGGAVMQMLCHNKYIFWGRRWGAETSGVSPRNTISTMKMFAWKARPCSPMCAS